MIWRTFASSKRGKMHIEEGTPCEDRSIAQNGNCAIAVIGDGHGDETCFRSGKGADLACQCVLELLGNFADNYEHISENNREELLSKTALDKLQSRVYYGWRKRIEQDLNENPISEEEYKEAEQRIRAHQPQDIGWIGIYRSGKDLFRIYGCTMLSVLWTEEFVLYLQIGDGCLMIYDCEGYYRLPMPESEKDGGGPDSLCDEDLLDTRNAFRIVVDKNHPRAVFLTTDGITDHPSLEYRVELYTMMRGLRKREKEGQERSEFNSDQLSWIEDFMERYSRGDDYTLAFVCESDLIADSEKEFPKFRLPIEELDKLWEDTVVQYERLGDEDPEKRNGRREKYLRELREMRPFDQMGAREFARIKDLLPILVHMRANEKEWKELYEGRLEYCRQLYSDIDRTPDESLIRKPTEADYSVLDEVREYLSQRNKKNEIKEQPGSEMNKEKSISLAKEENKEGKAEEKEDPVDHEDTTEGKEDSVDHRETEEMKKEIEPKERDETDKEIRSTGMEEERESEKKDIKEEQDEMDDRKDPSDQDREIKNSLTKSEKGDWLRTDFINYYQIYKDSREERNIKKKWPFSVGRSSVELHEKCFLEAACKYARYLLECERREAEGKA